MALMPFDLLQVSALFALLMWKQLELDSASKQQLSSENNGSPTFKRHCSELQRLQNRFCTRTRDAVLGAPPKIEAPSTAPSAPKEELESSSDTLSASTPIEQPPSSKAPASEEKQVKHQDHWMSINVAELVYDKICDKTGYERSDLEPDFELKPILTDTVKQAEPLPSSKKSLHHR